MILCSMALEDLDSYWNGMPFVLSNTLGQRLQNLSFSKLELGVCPRPAEVVNRFNGNHILGSYVLAPEEQHVYRRAFHKRNLAP